MKTTFRGFLKETDLSGLGNRNSAQARAATESKAALNAKRLSDIREYIKQGFIAHGKKLCKVDIRYYFDIVLETDDMSIKRISRDILSELSDAKNVDGKMKIIDEDVEPDTYTIAFKKAVLDIPKKYITIS